MPEAVAKWWELLRDTTQAIAGVALGALLGILAIILMLSSLTALAVWSGKVGLICLAGLIWLGACFCVFSYLQFMKGGVEVLHRVTVKARELFASRDDNFDIGRLAEWILTSLEYLFRTARKFFFLSMGIVSSMARLVTDIHLYLASGRLDEDMRAVFPQHHFSWEGLLLVVPPLLGFLADHLSQTRDSPRKLGKTVMFLATFDFIRCAYLLVLGLWGTEAFQASRLILGEPSYGSLIGIPFPVAFMSAPRREAAFVLYQIIGGKFFFLFFCWLPLYGIAMGLGPWASRAWHRLRRQNSRSTSQYEGNAISAFVASLGLLLLFASVMFQTGRASAAAGHLYYDYFHRGDPLERDLFHCLTKFTELPESASASCYVQSADEWEAELERMNGLLLVQLPAAGRHSKKAFMEADVKWRAQRAKTLTELQKKVEGRADGAFLVAQRRWEMTKQREQLVAAQVRRP